MVKDVRDLVMTVRCRVEDLATIHRYLSDMGLPGLETKAGICGTVLTYVAGVASSHKPEMEFKSVKEATEYLDEQGLSIGNKRSKRNTIRRLAMEQDHNDMASKAGIDPNDLADFAAKLGELKAKDGKG